MEKADNSESIEQFCLYFEQQIDLIESINITKSPNDPYQRLLYQRTLLVTLLDAMAGMRFSKKYYPDIHDKNRERFIRFVKNYSDWDNGSLISVPFLYYRLCKNKNNNGKLIQYLKTKISQFNEEEGGAVPSIKMDELPEKLLLLTNIELQEKEIYECQHYSILYRYRNYLIHEARVPGCSIDFYKEQEAHYHSYLNDPRWFLVYPLALLKKLCIKSVGNIKQYLRDNAIDPYSDDIFKDTSHF